MPSATAKKKSTRRKASGREPTRREAYASERGLNGTAAPAPEVNCAFAPMDGPWLLLPTNVVAEVVEYVDPDPVRDTPDWFLGQIEWESWPVPVFSYAALISGEQPARAGARAHIVIVKSLADSARVPYLGIVIRDIPRLLNLQPAQLVHKGDERKSLGVFCHVQIGDEAAVIPDLERLTHLVTHAAYGALPITQLG